MYPKTWNKVERDFFVFVFFLNIKNFANSAAQHVITIALIAHALRHERNCILKAA